MFYLYIQQKCSIRDSEYSFCWKYFYFENLNSDYFIQDIKIEQLVVKLINLLVFLHSINLINIGEIT